ncbi:G kinase-anchoring protein 1-like isoform X2 [Limulus polyphemus]|nr:G kinase-anchoring protein 1-like isoform X2 [Limulus polyphemus]XP_013775437.1 G kinase-anchoring protein 1-like isoform X2 [Limulus polyphemus]XP_022242692.1 G kinase-anchoring protein 1-like isoform X2 [Limulus polyphemus]XP_022242694.1 G kinase-anchoring protein 1-like isoform X2 [Limulus polyphemus]
MAVATASRFAVLKLEDDELIENTSSFQKASKTSSGTKSKDSAKIATNENKKKKKKKNNNVEKNELQNLAFCPNIKHKGKGLGQTSGGNRNSSHSSDGHDTQWEEWKKKDDEFVCDVYEQDLQEALLQSKLEFEEKKKFYSAIQKHAEVEKNGSHELKKKKKNSQKKDKTSTMTLDQFQNMLPKQLEGGGDISSSPTHNQQAPIPEETNFFEKIEEDAEKIITKEHRQSSYKSPEYFQAEHARSLQHQEEIERKDKKINELGEELKKTKEELKTVKHRCKKLCHILAQGEMRDKAEILVQVERITQVKDELTEEISDLKASLEQERSKVHALQTELRKYQGNKRESKERKDSK